jgi:hypothetical protein
MRTTALAAMWITGFLVLVPSLPADWQDQAPKAGLLNQLQTVYPLTVLDGIRVVKPGTVLVVQQDGIQANPMKIGPFRNKYANGQITAQGRDLLRKFDPTNGNWGLGAGMLPRILVAGEQVYLLKMDVRDDGITLAVQTCGSCDPAAVDPAHKPYIASIQFSFTRGFLAATDADHVQTAINPLLAVFYTPTAVRAQPIEQRDTAPVYSQTQTPDAESATPPVKFPDLTPPPPPPETRSETAPPPRRPTLQRSEQPPDQPAADLPAPPPRAVETKREVKTEVKPETIPEVNLGWTPNQVIAALGKPRKTDKTVRGREIYIYEKYGNMTVAFERGKVVAIVSSASSR